MGGIASQITSLFYCSVIDNHFSDGIMSTMASQIPSLTIVYSGADQIKHQSSASLAFVRGIHRSPSNSSHEGPVKRKMFPFYDVIMAMQGYNWPYIGVGACKGLVPKLWWPKSMIPYRATLERHVLNESLYWHISAKYYLKQKWHPNDPLRWRHNGHDGVSNHQPHHCLLNHLFGCRSKKTSKLRVTGLCAGNSPGPVISPHKGPVTRKMVPFDDVIMRKYPMRSGSH